MLAGTTRSSIRYRDQHTVKYTNKTSMLGGGKITGDGAGGQDCTARQDKTRHDKTRQDKTRITPVPVPAWLMR